MADPEATSATPPVPPAPATAPRRRGRWLAAAGVGVVLAVGLAWAGRMALADRLIANQLAGLGLPAHYRITSLDGDGLVLGDVRIGPADHPDFTARQIIVTPRLFGRGLGGLSVLHPRLYGRWQGGRPSFGSLDRLFYGPSATPFRLPDADLAIVDGQVGIASGPGGPGPMGLGVVGGGALRDGFVAQLALAAPQLAAGGCHGAGGFAGALRIKDEQPRLAGVLRAQGLACGAVRLAGLTVNTQALVPRGLDGVTLTADVVGGGLALPGAGVKALLGHLEGGMRAGGGQVLSGHIEAHGAAHALGSAQILALDGLVRRNPASGALSGEGHVAGSALAPGAPLLARLGAVAQASAGTLAQPLMHRLTGAITEESRASHLAGDWHFTTSGAGLSLVMPQLVLTGTSGAPVLTASRLLLRHDGQRATLAGNFTTAGANLPHVRARMEPDARGQEALHLAMEDYAAGDAHLALAGLTVAPVAGGVMLSGDVLASGAIPGGVVRGLHVPLVASITGNGVALWPRCTDLAFDQLAAGSLALGRSRLRLCPQGPALARLGTGGLQVAGTVPGLALAGAAAGQPMRLSGQGLRFALRGAGPGQFAAQGLDLALGASHYRLAAIDGQWQGGVLGGQFAGLGADLPQVVASEGAGHWRWAAGALALDGLGLRLADSQADARFAPLRLADGHVALAGGALSGGASLIAPQSGRVLTRLTLAHDLASGAGHVDFLTDRLMFDPQLQPDTLTPLALGTIANASGALSGSGQIAWGPQGLTSHGRFATDSFSFAAPFGQVSGVAGAVVFTDLLGLVTAPDQQLKIAAINPGIEIDDGVARFALKPGRVLAIDGVDWPFLDGHLRLLPTRMVLGATEVRHYELEAQSINAEKFLARMEVSNLAATGMFDGRLPVVFDQNGGRIVGGYLVSRPPGGQVSYVGALTYKDLSPIANYAFQALKSLRYKQMRIDMDGAIAGELVSRVAMKGLSQGQGASRNFLTRQVARLPLEFNVNLRAPFYQLITSFRSFYDASLLADPRSLGLVGADGRSAPAPAPSSPPHGASAKPAAALASVQPSSSEHQP